MPELPRNSAGLRSFDVSTWHRLVNLAHSLRCKATVIVVVLMLTVTATVSGYLLQSSFKLARGHQEEQVVQLAAMLAKAAAAPFLASDEAALEALATKSANGSPLLYVIFFDDQGHELAAAEHNEVGIVPRLRMEGADRAAMLGAPQHHPAEGSRPAFRDITYPVSGRVASASAAGGTPRGGEPGDDASALHALRLLGYVRTGAVANAWVRSLSSTLDLLIGVGILVTVVAIPLGFLLIRRIVSPLESLTGTMLRFSEGQLDVRSPVRRRDEIGCLVEAFNRMADQHQQTHKRIVRLNAELEERVALRTQQLRELASREPLTGLYNRRHFNEMLERRLSEALRYDGDLSCVMIDLDDFKSVNDRFGHQTGDEVLVVAAGTISGQLRSPDVAARFGGDEFILLLPQTDSDRAKVVGERILEQFATDIRASVPRAQAGMSMGIASLRTVKVIDADLLIRAADRALYQAKATGKNGIVVAASASEPADLAVASAPRGGRRTQPPAR